MTVEHVLALGGIAASLLGALMMYLQYRQTVMNASPYFMAEATRYGADKLMVTLWVKPGDAELRITAIKSRSPLQKITFVSDAHGRGVPQFSPPSPVNSLPMDELFPPAHVRSVGVKYQLLASTRDDRISLIIRTNRPLVRYSIHAHVTTQT